MDRLNFVLDEFTRFSWVSKRAERLWAPTLSKLSNFFQTIEREAVKAGVKPALIQNCEPNDLVDYSSMWLRDNKLVLALGRVKASSGYQSSTSPLSSNDNWVYRVVVGDSETAEDILHARIRQDWVSEGELLGYPGCCIKFFQKYWVDKKWIDTTLPMAQDWSSGIVHPANNILLRWAGLRLVSHLPCSFTCPHTKRIGVENIDLALSLGRREEIEQMVEILSWPMEWSSLHGIAFITTPVFKIVTRSDALPEKRVVRLLGDTYPKEAASGKVFPFRSKQMWLDNGFPNVESMEKAHSQLIDFAKPLFPRSVIDFGCGNMRLLYLFKRLFHAYVVGVDSDAGKSPTVVSDVFDVRLGESFDLALISINRLKEQPDKVEAWVRDLRASVKYLIVYSYEDSIDHFTFPLTPEEAPISRMDSHHILIRLQHDTSAEAV